MRPYDGFNGFEAEVFKAATGRGENNLLSDLSNRDQMIVLDLIESMKQRVGWIRNIDWYYIQKIMIRRPGRCCWHGACLVFFVFRRSSGLLPAQLSWQFSRRQFECLLSSPVSRECDKHMCWEVLKFRWGYGLLRWLVRVRSRWSLTMATRLMSRNNRNPSGMRPGYSISHPGVLNGRLSGLDVKIAYRGCKRPSEQFASEKGEYVEE